MIKEENLNYQNKGKDQQMKMQELQCVHQLWTRYSKSLDSQTTLSKN